MYRDHSVRTVVIRGRIDQLNPDDRAYVGAAAQLERAGVIDSVDIPARKFAGDRTMDIDFLQCCEKPDVIEILADARQALNHLATVRGEPFSVVLDVVNGSEAEARQDAEDGRLAVETFVPVVDPAPEDGPATG